MSTNTPPEVKAYLATIGKRGGKVRSRAKTLAVRANGRLGGRPKSIRISTDTNSLDKAKPVR